MSWSLDELTVEELMEGVRHDREASRHVCLECGAVFEEGEVFLLEGRYFEARQAALRHAATHGDRLELLMEQGGKQLTDHQKQLLRMMRGGLGDGQIASECAVAPSTVRHQRFVFREKANRAKLYLAAYQLAAQRAQRRGEELVPVNQGATVVDERYEITEEERDKVLKNVFSSMEPLKLKVFSAKEKKKVITLIKLSEQFERGRQYAERQVNEILEAIYPDYATLRRYLVEYGFLERTRDCRTYWRK